MNAQSHGAVHVSVRFHSVEEGRLVGDAMYCSSVGTIEDHLSRQVCDCDGVIAAEDSIEALFMRSCPYIRKCFNRELSRQV